MSGDSLYFFYCRKSMLELRCGELALVLLDVAYGMKFTCA